MGYDKDDLHVRNIALQFAVDYAGTTADRNSIVEIAAQFEHYLRNGLETPEVRRTFNDLPRL